MALAFQPRDEDLGRYRIVAKLGHGGMAELYLAKLVGAGGFEKLVAIKRMLPHLNEDPQFVAMFENEGRIAARLNHPNVCTVYELGEAKGGLFLAMEFLQGLSWSDIVDRLPREDQMICARIITGVLVQACAGLAYAHDFADVDGTQMPVVHRDVSPANLFVQKSGVVKLLDFGVSKVLTEGRSTRTGIIKGKLPYMAPEQIRGEPVDRRADVFSLGACAWEAVTGRLLFERASDYQIWKAVTEEPIPAIPSGDLKVLEPVILSALQRERDDRCASAQEFAARLRTAVEPFGGPCSPGELAALLVGRFSEQLDTLNRRLASVVQRFRPSEDEDPTTQRAEVKRSLTETKIGPADSAPSDDDEDDDVDAADDHTELDTPVAPVDPLLASMSGEMTAMSMPPRAEPPPIPDTIKEPRADSVPDISENVTARRGDVRMTAAQGGWPVPNPRVETPLPIGRPRWMMAGIVALGVMIVVLVYLLARGGSDVPEQQALAIDAAAVLQPESFVDSAVTVQPIIEPDAALVQPAAIADAGVELPIDAAARPTGETPKTKPRRDPPARENGFWTLNSRPYATIFVDGRSKGDTPLYRVELASGSHAVRAVRGDGKVKTFTIRIDAGQELNSGTLTW